MTDELIGKVLSLIHDCSYLNEKERMAVISTFYAGIGALSK